VRTTLIIDDALLRQAKQRAARMGLSPGALVERALRDALRERWTHLVLD
jgi:Arc/MetJ family transcription regulator